MGTFREIHIGELIKIAVKEQNITIQKIQLYFNCSKPRVYHYYKSEYISTDDLLKWCKLLRIDFFRIYSGHLMLHHGISSNPTKKSKSTDEKIIIRKNVYTKEIKEFIVSEIRKKEITIVEAISRYKIPKTTVYKWLHQI